MILGIIVLIGACLMIYYQIGPSLRVRGRRSVSSQTSAERRDVFGGYIPVEVIPKLDSDLKTEKDSDPEKSYDKSGDGKVLYVFNGGKTEIRPLDESGDPSDDDDDIG
jgi:hypothetical protein